MVKKILLSVVLAAILVGASVFGYKSYEHKYGVSWVQSYGSFDVIHYNNFELAIADSAGIVISKRFDEIKGDKSDEYLSYIIIKDDKLGYISSQTGKTLSNPEFEHAWVDNPKLGLAAFVKNKKLGFLDVRTGKIAINPQFDFEPEHVYYDYIFRDEGICIVPGKDSNFGIINTSGNIILLTQYSSIDFLEHSFIRVCQNGKYAIYDNTFNIVMPFEYDYLTINDLGIVAYKKDYIKGHSQYLLAYNGKDILNNLWLDLVDFEELVTPLYEPVLEKQEDDENPAYGARSSYSLYQIGDRYGVFDDKYRIIIPSKFESIDYLGNGYFSCLLNSSGAIVNSKGEFVHSK